jgi:hypothetical protein
MALGQHRRTDRMQLSWSYKRNEAACPNSFLFVMGAWRAPRLRFIVEPRQQHCTRTPVNERVWKYYAN